MLLSLIVAFDQNRVIGKEGTLPWRLPRDLRRFKELSLGKTVVMGRKTHQSIGRMLPERKNVVISSNAHLVDVNCFSFTSLPKALKALEGDKEVFIIGGESIYRESINHRSNILRASIEYQSIIYRKSIEYMSKSDGVIAYRRTSLSASSVRASRGIPARRVIPHRMR